MFGQIVSIPVAVTTVGGAGGAAGQADSPAIAGFLLDIYFAFGAAPATTDTTISYVLQGGNLLVLTNVNTSGIYAPRRQNVDAAGAVIAGSYDYYPLSGPVRIAVAQCDALAPALTAYIRYLVP
jgi:hypothetical protein